MTDANPYASPDAVLGTAQEEATYQPTIFSFNGRIGRMRYLAYGMGIMMLFMFVAGILAAILIPAAGAMGDGLGVVGMILMVAIYGAAIVLAVMFGKRRLNDLNRSGWWYLLAIVPLVNLLLSIYMLFFPGTDGTNNFGPAPAPNSVGVLILGWIVIVFFVGSIVAAIAMPAMMGMPY